MKAYEIKPNGFCNGVTRAIKIINEIIDNPNTIQPIYMLGYLVHNKKIIDSYRDKIKIITNENKNNFQTFIHFLKNTKHGSVIFTAHGISPEFYDLANKNNLVIIDTTCPKVKKIQNTIIEKIKNNYDILVIGQKEHPEVLSYLEISDNVFIYSKEKLIDLLKKNKKIFVINQTTLIYADVLKIYDNILEISKSYNDSKIEIMEEVCNATKERQMALLKEINNFDCFIIIGDKLSNNCDSLYHLALNNQKNAYKIEDVSELNNIDLNKYKKIGVTAGASTPHAILQEVIEQINNNTILFKSNLSDKNYIDIN